MLIVIGLAIGALAGVIVGQDAEERGMSGLGWGLFTFLIFIVAVPLYLIVRQEKVTPASTLMMICAQCGERGTPTKTGSCSACNAMTLVPLTSPRGLQLQREFGQTPE